MRRFCKSPHICFSAKSINIHDFICMNSCWGNNVSDNRTQIWSKLNLIGCYCKRKLNCLKDFQAFSFQNPQGNEIESLHTCFWHLVFTWIVFFLLLLPICLVAVDGKSVKWHLFLCYCIYFENSSAEMFLKWSLPTIWSLKNYLFWLVAMAAKKLNFWTSTLGILKIVCIEVNLRQVWISAMLEYSFRSNLSLKTEKNTNRLTVRKCCHGQSSLIS